MEKIDIKLSADRITAVAGSKISLKVSFDKPAFASVNERREVKGYENVIRTNEKVNGIDIEALVHDDTTDFIVMADVLGVPHLNERQNAVEAWYHVTVVSEQEPTEDLGDFQYKIEIVNDLHICKANDNDEDNWWDEDDFKAAMNIAADDKDIKAVMSCGDIAESQTNNDKKHPESTCEADYADFINIFDVEYWREKP